MPVYGLLGRKLGHSWSETIHKALGCSEYRLIELEPEALAPFFKNEDIKALNVTIPYKKDVMAFCDVIDSSALEIGSVNTIVRRDDGKLYAWNTDLIGFRYMVKRAGITLNGKKAGFRKRRFFSHGNRRIKSRKSLIRYDHIPKRRKQLFEPSSPRRR